jgi:NADH dehydrogenase
MILVAGATGELGGLICERLRERGDDVRALVRPTAGAEKVDRLRAIGVEIAPGNLRDPASLDAATRGVDVVISTVSIIRTAQPGDTFDDTDNAGTRALVDSAKRAGVSQFIYISFAHDRFDESPLVRAKRDVEQRLKESGISYTILQPTLFMEVWLGPRLGVDATAGTAKLFGSGDRPVNYVSVRDVAEYAVHCVRNRDVLNRTIEVGGPEAVSQRDAVRIFEDAFGKPFAVAQLPEDALAAQWREASDPFARTFASLMLGAARGDPIPATELERPFPIPLTSVRDYATSLARGRSR